jgi:hypothetical protein
MKPAILLGLFVVLGSCAAPSKPQQAASPDDLAAIRAELKQLHEAVDRANNRISFVQSRVEAASPDNEFTELVIDSVRWAERGEHSNKENDPVLLCHPTAWRGFGKLLRFTKLSDPVIFLESDLEPPIEAHMSQGGVSNDDGSVRFAVLNTFGQATPGVTYRLRPRNQNERYRWSFPERLEVVGR